MEVFHHPGWTVLWPETSRQHPHNHSWWLWVYGHTKIHSCRRTSASNRPVDVWFEQPRLSAKD
jgi:hypothetical protein